MCTVMKSCWQNPAFAEPPFSGCWLKVRKIYRLTQDGLACRLMIFVSLKLVVLGLTAWDPNWFRPSRFMARYAQGKSPLLQKGFCQGQEKWAKEIAWRRTVNIQIRRLRFGGKGWGFAHGTSRIGCWRLGGGDNSWGFGFGMRHWL